MRPGTTECVVNASALYQPPEPLVGTILYVEGGNVGTVSGNKNGTADLGPMQINTSWLKTLAPQYGITAVELRSRLVWDGCFNVAIGSWILRHNIDGCGNFWRSEEHTSELQSLMRTSSAVLCLKKQQSQPR